MNTISLHKNGTVTYTIPGTRILNTGRIVTPETLKLMHPADREAITKHLLKHHPELNQELKYWKP